VRRVLHTSGHFSPMEPDRGELVLSLKGWVQGSSPFSLPYAPESGEAFIYVAMSRLMVRR
jgi:hypothetical protein